jgi:hypothetical protein
MSPCPLGLYGISMVIPVTWYLACYLHVVSNLIDVYLPFLAYFLFTLYLFICMYTYANFDSPIYTISSYLHIISNLIYVPLVLHVLSLQ